MRRGLPLLLLVALTGGIAVGSGSRRSRPPTSITPSDTREESTPGAACPEPNPLATTMTSGLALAMAAGFYPFPNARVLGVVVSVLLLALTVTAIWLILSFERTEVAGWMAGTQGQGIDWKLLGHLLGVGVLPILALVAVEFPDVAGWLAGILDPLLSTLR